ncbi:MAG: twin-arginine translocase TatA/TatE family subunit [Anaerolineae bacterium]|nr:twin-arginine translocase TatA/TatE family subunit [Anaerolineae bacterium]
MFDRNLLEQGGIIGFDMEILNVGPLELLFILLIAFIVLGPEEAIRLVRSAGRLINRVMRSPLWFSIVSTSREIRDLPRKIVQETGVEDVVEEISGELSEISREADEQARVSLPVVPLDDAVKDSQSDGGASEKPGS